MGFWTQGKVGALCILAGAVWLGFSLADGPPSGSTGDPKATGERTACRVLRVTDGDTIECDLNDNGRLDKPIEEIRFLGIDTPEMHYSKKNRFHGAQDEPFAKEASGWTTKQLTGKSVTLEWDQQRHDPYGRSLAHVFETARASVSINEQLLKQGYATVLFIQPNGLHRDRYLQAEHTARTHGLGLWAKYVHPESTDTPPPREARQQPE